MERGGLLTYKLYGIKLNLILRAHWDLKTLVRLEKGNHQKNLRQAHLSDIRKRR